MALPARLRQKVPAPIKRVLRPLGNLVTTKGREELAFWKSVGPRSPVVRDAYYRKYLLAIAGEDDDSFLAGKIIADFGCGPAGSLTWAKSAAMRIGIDVLADVYADEFGASICAHDMVYVTSTERTIPLPGHFIDVLFTLNAMDHVKDFPAMCQELLRVMKPGGLFVGSFNLGESPTICEPQRLTEETIREHLLDRLEVIHSRTAEKGPPDNLYVRLLEDGFSEPVSPGAEGYLWVRAMKHVSA
jgi:SAM-dependent methyltransferase